MSNRIELIALWKDSGLSAALEENCKRFVASLDDETWTPANANRWYATADLEGNPLFKEINDAVEVALNWLSVNAGTTMDENDRLATVRFTAAVKYDIIGMVLKHLRQREEFNAADTRNTERMAVAAAVDATSTAG